MGKTRDTGFLSDCVFTDSSNNVGIGGAANASYKLAVTGASLFSSSINSGQIQATASGAVIQLIGQVGSNAYYVNDQINNSGKRWRFGHTGAVSGYNSFDFYNQTDDRLVMTLASGGNVGIGTSSPDRKLTIGGTTSAYMNFNATTYRNYVIGSDDVGFIVYDNFNSAYRMVINSSGNVGIGPSGTASSAVRLVVQGVDATSSNYAFIATNNSGSTLFAIRNDGLIDTGTRAASPYNNTYGNAANVYIGADGVMGRSTSSIKYKENVLDYTKGLAEVMQLRPVSYTSKNPNEEGQTFAGLIAEEVHDLGLTEFVQYAVDGTPDALAYANMVSLLTKAIQEQQAQIEEKNNKIIELEQKVNQLWRNHYGGE